MLKMKPKNKAKQREDLRLFYGLTIVLVPTILMAVVSQYITNNFFVRSIAQILLFFLQAIIVHGILSNKREEM